MLFDSSAGTEPMRGLPHGAMPLVVVIGGGLSGAAFACCATIRTCGCG